MSTRPVERLAYNAREAAQAVGVSERTIHKAIHATDPNSYPPPLQTAGRHGEGGKWAIRPVDLQAWVEALARFG